MSSASTASFQFSLIRGALALVGLASAIWLQVHRLEFGHTSGSAYTRCVELAGWPKPYAKQSKRTSWEGEVEYGALEWNSWAGILDCSILAIHAFAIISTAWLLRPSFRFTIGTTVALTAGIGAGLGVYCSLTFPERIQDMFASVGIGAGAFWGTLLLISLLNSNRPGGT